MASALVQQLTSTQPVSLIAKLGPMQISPAVIAKGLQELYLRGEFADVVLICAEQHFLAHRIVLAAQSEAFKVGLAQQLPARGLRHEVRLADIDNPEAVKLMLDFLYQLDDTEAAEYNPRTQGVNRDVLRLATQFKIAGLTHRAMCWLAKDLTTGNAVERLSICEEFGLTELTDKILDQLAKDRKALAEVSQSPEIMNYPRLMVSILQSAARAPESSQDEGQHAEPEPEPHQPKSNKRAKESVQPGEHAEPDTDTKAQQQQKGGMQTQASEVAEVEPEPQQQKGNKRPKEPQQKGGKHADANSEPQQQKGNKQTKESPQKGNKHAEDEQEPRQQKGNKRAKESPQKGSKHAEEEQEPQQQKGNKRAKESPQKGSKHAEEEQEAQQQKGNKRLKKA